MVGGKGHRLVKAKVIQQRRQTDSKRIGGDINMNVEISDDEEAAFHTVALFKEVGNSWKKRESVSWFFLLGGGRYRQKSCKHRWRRATDT